MKVIILPGWGQHSEHWKSVVDALAAHGINSEAIDLPGFGTEPADPDMVTLKDVSNWLEKKLSSYKKPLILCGHSFGGRVAADYAAAYPQACSKLILIGSPNLYRPGKSVRATKYVAKVFSIFKPLIPFSLRRKLRAKDYVDVEGTELEVLYKNIITSDQADTLKNIKATTLLLWGENDIAAPIAIANEMLNIIPNASLEIIKQASHDIHIEKPVLSAALIQKYVQTP